MPISPHKPKPQRIETTGTARFLTFGCYHHKQLLAHPKICHLFLNHLVDQSTQKHIHIWAYVIMPDHVHLLVYAPEEQSIRTLVSSVKRLTSYDALEWLKQHKPRVWSELLDKDGKPVFWQRGGGYDRGLWTPEKIGQALEYIHNNPIRADLTTNTAEYEWSSYREWTNNAYNIVNPEWFPAYWMTSKSTE